MKALSKVALLGLVAGLFVTATGCGQEGLPAGKSPEDVITDALLNQKEVTQFVFEMDMRADLKGEVDGENNALNGTFNISGTQDKDKMAMKMSIDGTMKGDGVDGDAKGTIELRVNDDGVFAMLSGVKVSDADTQDSIDTMLADYSDKWVLLSFMTPEDLLDEGKMAEFNYEEGDKLPFTNIQYKGNEDILGINSYHFTADIDEEKILDLVDAADVADTKQFLDAATMTGDVYVAVDEMVMTGFGGTMKLEDPEMNGTIDVNFKINPTKSDDVKTPDYTKELTEEDIAMLMFGGAMMDPSMSGGMQFDDSMMTDNQDTSNPEGTGDVDLSNLQNMQ